MRLWFGRCEGGVYKKEGRKEGRSRRGKERVRSGMEGRKEGARRMAGSGRHATEG